MDCNAVAWKSRTRLAKLQENVKFAQARLDSAKARLRENDALAQQEVKNNFEAAQVRLKTAQQKLQQIQLLEKQGAISKFQLYDMQDVYATRRKELQAARQGIFTVQDRLFSNQDFYLDLRNKVIAAQQDLQIAEEGIDRDLAKTRLSVENGRIELQNAVRDLSKTVIYATTDGLVSEVNINAGEIAESGSREPLVSLTQNVVFKGYIDQARLNAVKEGDKATVRLVAYPGRTFEGQVIQVNPTVETEVNRQRRVGVDRQYTYSIWVAVDELQMSPGLQGYVQFNKAKTALAIPESAVTHLSAGEGMVMVAEGGKAVVKKVKLGRTFDNQRQVIKGLTPGEQVVLNARALNPGDKLDIKSAPMPIADNR